MNSTIGFALLLSALAGLSTTVGSLLGIFIRKPGPRFMTLTLGFSAGAMILVSFVELLPGGIEAVGFALAHLAFFGGMVAMFLVDALIPHDYMAEHHHTEEEKRQGQLLKTGLFVALGIGIHNFPEGMASFAGALESRELGTAIAFAVAVHNIPEGLAVSAPIYAATGSRGKAFLWSFLSGLAEPVGAGLAALVLMPFLNETVLGIVLAAVAGIMVFISLDELVPVARSFGEEHLSIVGVVAGMVVMALSLWMLR
ncbi:MAG: zinc transporter ZupT [Anaerolineae bacterium]|nr:zinc transporter ZupT [Anaerolineae bacterium]